MPFFDMLSIGQREVFAELLTQGYEGISHLRQRVMRKEQEERERREREMEGGDGVEI